MSLGYSGSLEPSKDSEFRCDVCKARCTRSPIDGTEFGHLVGCPNRPEKLKKSCTSGNHYYKPDDGGASA